MSDEQNDILGPDPDREQLTDATRSLDRERPLPSPAFRGELGRLLGLVALVRPVTHWRAKALALAAAGALLLGAAGAGVAGSGPLAPQKEGQGPSKAAGTTAIPSGRR